MLEIDVNGLSIQDDNCGQGEGRLVEDYQVVLSKLPEKPILIGRSLGVLITQLLV